jgi:2-polyprenyl-3-methyl-5-hydroxy-6-metoxy-1,4-benzoquinol methylase
MKNNHIIELKEKNWKRNFPGFYRYTEFSKFIKDSKKHLDFGCGFGILPYLLAKQNPKKQFYGVDIDKELLSIAKKKYRLPNLSFDINQSTKYDSVSIVYVLHHIENVERILIRILKKLNKKGKVIILEFKKRSKKKFLELYENSTDSSFEEYYSVHNRWTKKEFQKMCEDVGIKTLSVKDFGDFWFVYVGEKQ